MGTMPMEGWVAKDGTSCSYPKATFPQQFAFDPYNKLNCGDGLYPERVSGCTSPSDATFRIQPTKLPSPPLPLAPHGLAPGWPIWCKLRHGGQWRRLLLRPGQRAGLVGCGHRDVHPVASTYDEVTNNGIATAEAIKSRRSDRRGERPGGRLSGGTISTPRKTLRTAGPAAVPAGSLGVIPSTAKRTAACRSSSTTCNSSQPSDGAQRTSARLPRPAYLLRCDI